VQACGFHVDFCSLLNWAVPAVPMFDCAPITTGFLA
jgi:hypothetical protein